MILSEILTKLVQQTELWSSSLCVNTRKHNGIVKQGESPMPGHNFGLKKDKLKMFALMQRSVVCAKHFFNRSRHEVHNAGVSGPHN